MGYDERQTEMCNRLRNHLQSIAILAVQAQDLDPSGDPLGDLLGDIARDVEMAQDLNAKLNCNAI